jgi:hypothetical protein
MAKPHSTKLVETDFDEYLELRINQLGLHTSVANIRASAIDFQQLIDLVHNQANASLALGLLDQGRSRMVPPRPQGAVAPA